MKKHDVLTPVPQVDVVKEEMILDEMDLLKVKCASYEFQLLQSNLQAQYAEGAKKYDGVLNAIVDPFRDGFTGQISVDLETGALIFKEPEQVTV